MNIKQLRYFAAVVECGSLSAAAKNQFVTVQAVSKAIADLERELGHSLFVRESRGVHLTPFGKAFRQKALPVLQDFEELESFAAYYQESLQHGAELRLALCSPPFFGNERARESIAAFAKKGLGCSATVALETGEGGMDGLREGLYDALITIGSFSHSDVDCVSVGTVGPGVLMAEDHPLASHDEISLPDLAQYSIAASLSFDSFNDSIVTLYRKRKAELQFITVASENVQQHIFKDHGVAFLANVPSLGDMLPGTVMKPMISGDSIAIPLCLITLKSHKAPVYCAFEKWLEGALLLLGGGLFKEENPQGSDLP